MSNRVLFPRFQYEKNSKLIVNERDLAWRVPEREWMSAHEWEQTTHLRSVERTRFLDLKGEWWGVFHAGQEMASREQEFICPVEGEQPGAYRSVVTRHRYIWKGQTAQCAGTEIVLVHCSEDAVSERAALLSLENSATSKQRFVVASEQGWVEPEFEDVDNRRDFCLMVMTELAMRPSIELRGIA